MGLFYVHETPCSLKCIEHDLETITNSMMCKVEWVYLLQSVPHPKKNAPIMSHLNSFFPLMVPCVYIFIFPQHLQYMYIFANKFLFIKNKNKKYKE